MQTSAAYQISHVAQMLKVSRSAVYRLVRDKRLTLVKVEKRGSRITADSLAELLKSDGARESASPSVAL